MKPHISGQIAHLRQLSRQQLLDLWQKLYKKAISPGLRREVMIPFLAYRIQEIAYGGLKTTARSELRRVARALEKGTASEILNRSRLKPGTRLSRHWHGKVHEVIVTESGFEYGGVAYRSLSEIARRVTGTRWSGPTFFGLNKKPTGAAGQKND
jgi:Protein of unknown function (DUF2924)